MSVMKVCKFGERERKGGLLVYSQRLSYCREMQRSVVLTIGRNITANLDHVRLLRQSYNGSGVNGHLFPLFIKIHYINIRRMAVIIVTTNSSHEVKPENQRKHQYFFDKTQYYTTSIVKGNPGF